MNIPGVLSQKINVEDETNPLKKGLSLLASLPQENAPSFSQLVKQVGASAVDSLNHGEHLANQAALGTNVDSQAVALGMLNASSSIRQLTGIISAGTQSYKEIERMQI